MIDPKYNEVRSDIVALLDAARTASVRSVNALMTATLLGDRTAHCGV